MIKIGVVDTTFSRVDMAKYAIEVIEENLPEAEIIRYTVPGIKDIPVAARRLLIDEGCDAVITLGWVGPGQVDKYSYLAMSVGLIMLQIMTGKHVIDVTVHEDEAGDLDDLYNIAVDRARKHALNLVMLVKYGREALTQYAGKGLRQGRPDEGPIKE
ncbi:riboflavin synthase alpha chain [Staphylothermus marinus F1]|uniref:Riboflavin synthase n=1 Tax=Staphylothermus marinus (strain ATCC 43588 / DSM 3639 / JCM 9404 / F1) TaxID=399550 RepID=A3DLT6_STAMF|nr:riboflavin synthase [Staphylothermus marinus]ABN69596.1 riboflavin synthase alpha chain [Staphylothermus marinus F1]